MTKTIEIRQIEGVTTAEAIRTASAATFLPLDDGGLILTMYAGGVEFEMEIGADGRVMSCDTGIVP